MLGRNQEEIVGRQHFRLHGRRCPSRHEGADGRSSVGQARTYENRILDAAGRPIWVQLAATPIYDSHGGFAGSVAMATNLTSRLTAEQVSTS